MSDASADFDEAYRIAKQFGCTCVPVLVDSRIVGFSKRLRLRHRPNCRFDPPAVFSAEELDQEALDASAKLMKRSRAKATRLANRRRQP